MAELDEKLNSILGNPSAMQQIMSLAQSLTAGNGTKQDATTSEGDYTPVSEQAENASQQPDAQPSSMPDLSAILGQLDPNMLQIGTRLIQEYQSDNSRNVALLSALRPFLKEDRRERLDKAVDIARMTRLIRVMLGAFGAKGGEEDV